MLPKVPSEEVHLEETCGSNRSIECGEFLRNDTKHERCPRTLNKLGQSREPKKIGLAQNSPAFSLTTGMTSLQLAKKERAGG